MRTFEYVDKNDTTIYVHRYNEVERFIYVSDEAGSVIGVDIEDMTDEEIAGLFSSVADDDLLIYKVSNLPTDVTHIHVNGREISVKELTDKEATQLKIDVQRKLSALAQYSARRNSTKSVENELDNIKKVLTSIGVESKDNSLNLFAEQLYRNGIRFIQTTEKED